MKSTVRSVCMSVSINATEIMGVTVKGTREQKCEGEKKVMAKRAEKIEDTEEEEEGEKEKKKKKKMKKKRKKMMKRRGRK